jgi:hypothetical protein
VNSIVGFTFWLIAPNVVVRCVQLDCGFVGLRISAAYGKLIQDIRQSEHAGHGRSGVSQKRSLDILSFLRLTPFQ